ncbi:hypothetical protein [Henriciella mobilis]|uniref:Uncharacterized protein n=1 Tax=Henriciella mobilis TaxID=2305467 RepID=A0A399RMJ8_9PROT|nr:hypothetical protein [Henriciella mobilis]RIJ32990.1 hypothetical protein D1223_03860 [Henriciella mobilis]
MLTRAWILETLALLPLYYWPVFFLEVWRFERYYRAYRAANPVGMLGVAVLPNGRLVITLQVAGDRPDPDDWTNFAPRAPWVRLAPGGFLAALDARLESYRNWTVLVPESDPNCTVAGPAFLDSS